MRMTKIPFCNGDGWNDTIPAGLAQPVLDRLQRHRPAAYAELTQAMAKQHVMGDGSGRGGAYVLSHESFHAVLVMHRETAARIREEAR